MTEEHKQKIREALIGRNLSIQHRKSVSVGMKKAHKENRASGFKLGHSGYIPKWRYKEIGKKISLTKKGKPITITKKFLEAKKLAGLKRRGILRSNSVKEKIRNSLLGKKHSFERRLHQSESHKGEKAWNWKGGVTAIGQKIRRDFRYREWQLNVIRRDNYTCQTCSYRQGAKFDGNEYRIEAHHPIPVRKLLRTPFEKYIFDIGNGVTLCPPCHRKITFAK